MERTLFLLLCNMLVLSSQVCHSREHLQSTTACTLDPKRDSLLPTQEDRLECFRQATEKAAGKPVSFDTNDPGFGRFGGADCFTDPNKIVIHIQSDLTTEQSTAVKGHELGHAMLCARGISILGTAPISRSFNHYEAISAMNAANIIASCPQEPVATKLAEGWGIDSSPRMKGKRDVQERQSKASYLSNYLGTGDLYSKELAVTHFCVVADLPGTKTEKQREILSWVPGTQAIFDSLESEIVMPTDGSMQGYFITSKQIRHVAGLDNYILLQNPSTRQLE